MKYTTDKWIKKANQKHGSFYDYSNVVYNNSTTKILIKCPKHGIFKQTPSSHLAGSGCPKCYHVSHQGQQRRKQMTQEHFIQKAKQIHGKKYDYSLVIPNGYHKKITIICPTHGPFQQTIHAHLSRKNGCKKCGVNSKKRLEISIRSSLSKDKFIVRAKTIHKSKYDYSNFNYTNYRTHSVIVCPKHGPFQQSPMCHLQGCGCPQCKHFSSKAEKEINNFIQTKLNIPTQQHKRDLIKGEVDIYIPSLNIAIEYNGLYWHSSAQHRITPSYHLNKTIECEKKGIHLIHIFENEWSHKKEIVKSRLRTILHKNQHSYMAHKCTISSVSKQQQKQFLETNHIQGFINSTYAYGLYNNKRLIVLITFGKQRISLANKQRNNYELLRFCTINNANVIDGAQRLFKHFIKNHKPQTIVSFANRSWFTTIHKTLYDCLGMQYVHNTSPNYWYFKPGQIHLLHRLNFQKHKLIKKGVDSSKTERELMSERGYYHIYDCGQLKYEWKQQENNS